MHVNYVSNVTSYHLSDRCLPNVLKITVKINAMQNNQHFAFCSFTVLSQLKECLMGYGPISNRLLLTLQLASEESVSTHVSVQMVDILNIFVEKNSCKQLAFFMCFWFKWLLSIVSAFYRVDA